MEFLDNGVNSIRPFCQRLRDDNQRLKGEQLDILLLDVSGSMSGTDYSPTRLDGAKQASISFVKRVAEFNPESAIAIISFSGTASVVCMPVSANSNMASLKQAIYGLTIEGSTNIPAGLELSEEVIRKYKNAVTPRILLLTDGASNEGGPPIPVAGRLKERGIQIDIIGIGGSPSDVNEKELKEMASVVNGELRYWFIKSVGELVKKFENLAIREVK